ncbi:TRAP transporter small permease subunit [Chloroflexota bacterium]
MKIITKVVNIFDRTTDLLAVLSAVLIIFMMLIVCTEVAMRYFFRQPMSGVIEIAEYCILFFTFFAATWILKGEGHVTMDLVLNRLAPRVQAIANVIISIICAIVCITLIWYGVDVTRDHFQINYLLPTVLQPPSFIIIVIIPIGYLLLFVQFVRRAHKHFSTLSQITK